DGRYVARVRPDQHDVRGLDRHVGARADRDPDVGLGERRSVVHAVPGHRDGESARLDLLDLSRLLLGQDLGEELVKVQLARSPALRTTPASDWLSKLAARRSNSCSLWLPSEITSVTPKRPSVSVPVLSKTIASSARARSKAERSRIRRPWPADSAVDIATTSGPASPSACGHALTM